MTTWNLQDTRHHVLICNGGSCMSRLGEEVTQAIRDEIAANGADGRIHTSRTRCNGRCVDACVVIVYPQGVWYGGMTPESGRAMVREHLLGGRVLEEYAVYGYDGDCFAVGAAHSVSGTVKPEGGAKPAAAGEGSVVTR